MKKAFASIWLGWSVALLLGLGLSGCDQWVATLIARLTPSPTLEPTHTPGGPPFVTTAETPTPELPATCAFVWSTRALPDVTTQINQVFQKMGLNEVEVNASAYGEDCLDTETNQVVRFSALQTNFDFFISLNSIADPEELGGWLERIMKVLESFAPGKVPGPVAGTVGVSFSNGTDRVDLFFSREKAVNLLKEGLRGQELFEALRGL
jgi:hypothetical protein